VRFTEGRAWIDRCPRCERPIIEAHVDGMKLRFSTRAVPYADAVVLSRYTRIVVNVWIGITQLWVGAWHHMSERPSKGRLYALHSCGAWK
jgi:hypothetical protein